MLKRIEEAVQPISTQSPGGIANNSTTSQMTNGTRVSPTVTNTKVQPNPVQTKINKAIQEAPDLIAALECVGAMYGIPPTSIIADDTATGIRVQNDNIIAPPIANPKNQTKPIIQAVGSVLDYISQRIDDKLNDYQMDNIEKGRVADAIAHANPRKGKCIGRYEDDEGGEILAYDTGLVDMPNTPAGRAKVAELRENNTIPMFDPSANRPSDMPGLSYFTDEDDIAADVDMSASADNAAGEMNIEPTDIAEKIQESAYHVNMVAKMGDTTHLGYDLLQKHGFDFVKPIDSVVMESKTEDDDDKPKKKRIKASDIKHLKFDNTGILNAVKYFNKAREAQDNVKKGKMDLNAFINDPNYEKAIDGLNKQFNCRINLRFMKTNSGKGNAGTFVYPDLKKKLAVSKSKGFQLGGLPIEIMVYNHYFEESSPNDIELFGQNMVSTICHEIFHNIACVMRDENAKSNMSLVMTLDLAASAKTIKERRIIITNYVDSLEEMSKSKTINRAMKKKLIKQLMAITTVQDDEKLIKQMNKSGPKTKEDADKYIDSLLKRYKKVINRDKVRNKTKYIGPALVAAISCVMAVTMPGTMPLEFMIFAGAVSGGSLGLMLSTDYVEYMLNKQYKNSQLYEEYYCDLFAAIYGLPKFFFVGPSKNKYVANDFRSDKLNELAKLEKEFYEMIHCSYPTDLERTHAGVKAAKKLLEQKDLDPALKKYCQWVVDNFSSVRKTDIDKLYNTTTFDPKEAEDLDKHIEDLINDNNIVLTESFIKWLSTDETVF